jgi:hypothetical protein
MSEAAAEIAGAEAQLGALLVSWRRLRDGNLAELAEFDSRVASIQESRLQSITQYQAAEIAAAETNLKGALYLIDNDHERALEIANSQVRQLLRTKFKLLTEELPEASEFFRQHRSDCPFLAEFCEACDIPESFDVTEPFAPVLSNEAMETALAEMGENQRPYRVENDVLVKSNVSFNVGSTGVLRMGKVKLTVMIHAVTRSHVEFLDGDGAAMSLPLAALNFGLADLSKE